MIIRGSNTGCFLDTCWSDKVGKVGVGRWDGIELKKGHMKLAKPTPQAPFEAFHAQNLPWSCDFATSDLAKDIGVGLLCVKSAGIVVVGKLGRSIRVVKSPSSFRFSLIAQTGTGWFPRFVEGLEIEDIFVPAEQSAYALLKKGVSFIDAVYCASVAGSS